MTERRRRTTMTSPSASDNFNTFLERELSEREKEEFKRRNDEKYTIRNKPRRKLRLIERIIRRMT